MEKLHVYTRVSSESQEDNTSLKQQAQKGERIAEINGFEVCLWNEGVKSSSSEDLSYRPVLLELLNKVDSGEVKHLYVEYTDRLSRNNQTWSVIRIKLKRNEVKLYKGTDPNPIDLSDPLDNLLFGILNEFSVFDNDQRTNRLHNGKFQRVKEGRWHGGSPPYGYRLENSRLVPDEKEAIWVKKIFELYSQKKSIEFIREVLAKNGVMTRRGKPIFSHGSLEKLLSNSHYGGTYSVTNNRTGEVYECKSPRLIDEQLFNRVKVLRKQRSYSKRHTPSNTKHNFLITNKGVCSVCGCSLGVQLFADRKEKDKVFCKSKEADWRRKKEGRQTFDCSVKGSVKLHRLEEVLWTTVLDTLENSAIFIEQTKIEYQPQFMNKKYDEIKATNLAIKKINKDIKIVTSSIDSLNENIRANPSKRDEYKPTIEALEAQKEELASKIYSKELTTQKLKKDVEWIDWLSKFKEKIEGIRTEESQTEKKVFFDGIVEKVEVLPQYDKGLHHTVKIFFKYPYVNDKFYWKDRENKKLGYVVEDGVNVLETRVKKP